MKVIVSLHDVTPFHFARLERAEVFCASLGLQKLTYLFVPNYHGSWLASDHPAFVAWCRKNRSFDIDWHLHGYHHREDRGAERGGASWTDSVKRRLLTAGEGEFLAMDAQTQRSRIEAGRRVFETCLGHEPEGFVAPAWLSNPSLTPLLTEFGFRSAEDHSRVMALQTERTLTCPVITWATRTRFRKRASILVAPWLLRLWAGAPILRVALHPFDFDHPETVGSIRTVLTAALRNREQSFWRDLSFADSADMATLLPASVKAAGP